jgi:hypothetical protein
VTNVTDDETSEEPEQPDDGSGDDNEPESGPNEADELRKALALERRERKRVATELEDLRRNSLSESERAVAEAHAAGRSEALGEVSTKLLAAEVRARAADKSVDPDAVVALLDLTRFEADEDGAIDTVAIGAAIDDLLRSKPYLAKPADNGKPPRAPQGTRGAPGSPAPPSSDGESWLRRLRAQ